jgi:hypothetical protein
VLSARRSRVIVSAAFAIAAGMLMVVAFAQPLVGPPVTPVTIPSPSPAVLVPLTVQALADKAASFHYSSRIDRTVIVQLGKVSRSSGGYGIWGATDGTWVIAMVGDFRQSRGVLPVPNHQCEVWFVNSLGLTFATHGGTIQTCDPYFAAK